MATKKTTRPSWQNMDTLVRMFIDYDTLGSREFHAKWDATIRQIVAEFETVTQASLLIHCDFNDHVRWAMKKTIEARDLDRKRATVPQKG